MIRVLLVLAVCVAVALGGCGGGNDSASTSSTSETTSATTQASRQSTTAQKEGKQADRSSSAGNQKPNGSTAKQGNEDNDSKSAPKRVKVPPISSAPVAGSRKPAPGVKTVKDGDNSVQEYGVEADESERREAAIALQAYLNARAEEDWGSACSMLARKPTEQIEKLAGDKADCAEVLEATGKETRSQPGSTITEVLSLRGGGDISGDPSYLIFEGPPGQTLFSMPMYSEGGAWKVGLAQPSELPV